MNIRTTLVLALMILGGSSASAESPQTMRLNFFHSGNFETEMFSLDEVVIETLPWTGNMQQPVDKTLRGKYLFEIADDASDDISWSRSFSSIGCIRIIRE